MRLKFKKEGYQVSSYIAFQQNLIKRLNLSKTVSLWFSVEHRKKKLFCETVTNIFSNKLIYFIFYDNLRNHILYKRVFQSWNIPWKGKGKDKIYFPLDTLSFFFYI